MRCAASRGRRRVRSASTAKATFAIPADDLSPRWDLLYYFEVLDRERSGWFEPDPDRATPYYVVKVDPAASL